MWTASHFWNDTFYSLNLLPHSWFISPRLKLGSSWTGVFSTAETSALVSLLLTTGVMGCSGLPLVYFPCLPSHPLLQPFSPALSKLGPNPWPLLHVSLKEEMHRWLFLSKADSLFQHGCAWCPRCMPGSPRVMLDLTCHPSSLPMGCFEALPSQVHLGEPFRGALWCQKKSHNTRKRQMKGKW